MSRIPDCRTDKYYNQKYLNKVDGEFVHGFDWCAEQAVDIFFDNLDYLDSDHLLKVFGEELPEALKEDQVTTYGDLLRVRLAEWIESHRDELITAMIDSMSDDEYKAIKAGADKDGEAK